MCEPEWNAKNMNMKEGDTTLKQCGWCKYRGTGSYRHDCMLDGYCNLIEEYHSDRDVKWDTQCIIPKLGKKDLEHMISSKDYDIKESNNKIKSLNKEIDSLKEISETLPNKPPLPNRRVDDYDNGEIVWVYTENKWHKATVVSGYRSHDGCVSYIIDDIPQSNPPPKGNGPWGCGVSVPVILKDWEFNYFKKHKDDFKIWLEKSDVEYNGEMIIDMERMMNV